MPDRSNPQPRSDEECLAKLLSDWQQEHAQGRAVPVEQICQQRPDLAAELERRIQAIHGNESRRFPSEAGNSGFAAEHPASSPAAATGQETVAGSAAEKSTGEASEVTVLPTPLAPGGKGLEPSAGGTAARSPQGPLGPSTASMYPFLTPAQEPDELGRLGPYRLLKLLGAGGMGLVFQAEADQLHRPVALKVMKPDLAASPTARQRFLREARLAAAVRHDHLTTIYQVGEDHGVPYLAMELLSGESLDQYLKRHDSLPLPETLSVARQMAEGLAVAHGQGLIHRDIKPGNIWLEDEPRHRVKILDFGLARRMDTEEGLTQMGEVLGTPQYMAPEQAAGEAVDHRFDLFSLGCVLYRMLTGQLPFKGRNMLEVLRSLAVEEPSARQFHPDVPPALVQLVIRMLAKDPKDRPESAAAVAQVLAAIEQAEMRRLAARPVRQRRLPLALAAGVLLAIVGIGGVLFGPAIYRFSTNQGEVVIETDDPNVEVTVRGPDIRILDTKTNQAVTLKAGRYQVELSKGSEGLRLSTREFTLERAGMQIVKVTVPEPAPDRAVEGPTSSPLGKEKALVPARWKPGTGESDLSGLATRPAKIPGVRRWQVTTLAPGARIKTVAWSPDSRWLVCGGFEPYLRIYERSTGRLIKVLVGHGTGGVASVAWSPDGKQIASGGGDGTLRRWDAETGTSVWVLNPGFGDISTVAWSPDGRRLAAAGGNGKMGIWQVKDGSPGPLIQAQELRPNFWPLVQSICWSPDGTRIASGGADGLRVWEAATGKPDRDFQPGKQIGVLRVAWSPDGRWIVSKGVDNKSDHSVRLWDAKTGQAGPAFARASFLSPLAWSPDGKRLVLGKSYHVEMWDGAPESPPRLLTPLLQPQAIAWSPDGRWIALAGTGQVFRLWNVTEGKPGPVIQETGDYFLSVSWSGDGMRLATGDSGGAVRVWDRRNGEPGPVLHERGPIQSVAWRPDGQHLAFVGSEVDLQLWSGAQGASAARFGKNMRGHELVWSPDGRRLAILGQFTDLWDVTNERLEATLKVCSGGLAWRPDGNQVATACNDDGVQLWNAGDAAAIGVLKDSSCFKVAWSRDGKHLATIWYDGLHFWDATGSTMLPVPAYHPGRAVAWSPREEMLAYGTFLGQVGVCGVDGKVRHQWQAHQDVVHSLCWDPSGEQVASCSYDGTLGAWDARTGQSLCLTKLLAGGKTATFGPAGELLHADAGAENHLVYLVERTAGQVDLLTADEFKQLLTRNPPEMMEPPAQRVEEKPVVPARWQPGPGDSSLSGLVARPAQLPGVRRWQVTTTAPGGTTLFVSWSPDSQRLVCGGMEPYLRVYERASGRLLKVLVGHGPGGAWSGVWSPDGKQIASGGGLADSQIRLWDVESGTCRRTIALSSDNISVAWSPDGRNLAAAGSDGSVGIWAVADGSPGPRMKGHSGEIYPLALSVCWSPDGTRIASTGRDGVRVWEAATGKPDPDFHPGNPGTILKVAWSGDGRWIAGAGPSQVTLWEARTGRTGPSFPTDRYGTPLAWNPDGTQLVFGKRNSVEMWSGVGGSPPRQLTPLMVLDALAWSADGRWIALAGRDGVLRLWDAAEGKPGTVFPESGNGFRSVSWSADGEHLATGDTGDALRIWDSRNGEQGPVHKEPAPVESVAWRPEGKELAFAGHDSVQFWRGVHGESPTRFGEGLRGSRVVWSPDGRRLAVLGQLVELWDVTQQRREATLNVHCGSVAWRPDGMQLASSGTGSGELQLWNAADGKMDQTLKGLGSIAVAWSRDGKHLAWTGFGGLHIWDETRKTDLSVQNGGRAVAWSPRENILAYGRWGGLVGVCGADGKIRLDFQAHHADVSAVCWDPQGRYVASCSTAGTLWAWDSESGQPLWQAVLLAGGKTATFGPAGELLHADAGAENHLVCLVERTPGKVDLLTVEEFKQLLIRNPPEMMKPPAQEVKK